VHIDLFVKSGKLQGKRWEESHPECIIGLWIGLLQVTENCSPGLQQVRLLKKNIHLCNPK